MITGTILSIIIPMYNGQKFIHDTVNRLMEISVPIEVLIIDDGSTDDSLANCQSIYEKCPNIRVIHKENGGIASARNFGMEHANGDLVMFIDQDDFIVPNVIDKAVQLFSDASIDCVCWSTEKLFNNGSTQPFTRNLFEGAVNRFDIINELVPNLLYGKSATLVDGIGQLWAMMFRTEQIREWGIQFKYFISYEDDHLFVLDYLLKSQTVYLMKQTGYQWRIHEESFSHKTKYIENHFDKTRRNYMYRLKNYRAALPQKENIEAYECYMQQEMIVSSIHNFASHFPICTSEMKKTIQAYKEYKEAFHRSYMLVDAKYQKTMYRCLKTGHIYIAIILTTINEIKMRLRNKMR